MPLKRQKNKVAELCVYVSEFTLNQKIPVLRNERGSFHNFIFKQIYTKTKIPVSKNERGSFRSFIFKQIYTKTEISVLRNERGSFRSFIFKFFTSENDWSY